MWKEPTFRPAVIKQMQKTLQTQFGPDIICVRNYSTFISAEMANIGENALKKHSSLRFYCLRVFQRSAVWQISRQSASVTLFSTLVTSHMWLIENQDAANYIGS